MVHYNVCIYYNRGTTNDCIYKKKKEAQVLAFYKSETAYIKRENIKLTELCLCSL